MKKTFLNCIAAAVLLASSASMVSSCSQHKEQVEPVQSSKQEFAGTLLQSLQILDVTSNGVLVLSKKADEYSFLISKVNASGNAGLLADDDSAPMVVCQGSGLSFIKCYQGYLDKGATLTVKKCGDSYCAYN